MAKIDVNGDKAHPLYEFMKKARPGVLGTKAIKWNFTAFLIDKHGIPVERFSPGASASEIEKCLIPLLEATS
ncbi:glutathione peroxidase-like protein [Trypanosoma grayi]|uniref:glutathione peroxidase-like protein n=1 Tax=Trypanosoma grayi TaxID=71804 RepID=UPI0004F4B0F0|nr:glutathione peroxidase-like protein [Trypanosoma grayi]KEG12510.1 glutathione peroxidase-like protein [Trypanosoma grayi]